MSLHVHAASAQTCLQEMKRAGLCRHPQHHTSNVHWLQYTLPQQWRNSPRTSSRPVLIITMSVYSASTTAVSLPYLPRAQAKDFFACSRLPASSSQRGDSGKKNCQQTREYHCFAIPGSQYVLLWQDRRALSNKRRHIARVSCTLQGANCTTKAVARLPSWSRHHALLTRVSPSQGS